MMWKKRSSIKGIGASIFYDVEDSAFNAKLYNGQPTNGQDDPAGDPSTTEGSSPSTVGPFYDSEELVALLESQVHRMGDDHWWRVEQASETTPGSGDGRPQRGEEWRAATESTEASTPIPVNSGDSTGAPDQKRQGAGKDAQSCESCESLWNELGASQAAFLEELAAA